MSQKNITRKDFLRNATGAVSILVGIAASKSIESGEPVRIEDLVALKPHANRGT